MSYKSFSELSDYLESQKEAYSNLSVWSALSSLFTRVMSILNSVASNYARAYALVQQIKYDEDGNIEDVTSEERASVADNVLSQAREALMEVDVDRANLPRPTTTDLQVTATGDAQVEAKPYVQKFSFKDGGGYEVNVVIDIDNRTVSVQNPGGIMLVSNELFNPPGFIPPSTDQGMATDNWCIPLVKSGSLYISVLGVRVLGNMTYGVAMGKDLMSNQPQICFFTRSGNTTYAAVAPVTLDSGGRTELDLGSMQWTFKSKVSVSLEGVSGDQHSETVAWSEGLPQIEVGCVGTYSSVEVTADVTAADLFNSVVNSLDIEGAIQAIPK